MDVRQSKRTEKGDDNKESVVATETKSTSAQPPLIDLDEETEEEEEPVPKNASTEPSSSGKPFLLDHMVMGINEIYKTLERQSATLYSQVESVLGPSSRPTVSQSTQHGTREMGVYSLNQLMSDEAASTAGPSSVPQPPSPSSPLATEIQRPLRIIFACKDDVDPIDLIECLPRCVAQWNLLVRHCRKRLMARMREVKNEEMKSTNKSSSTVPSSNTQNQPNQSFWDQATAALLQTEEIYLVPMPAQSEVILARSVGLRRLAVIGLRGSFPTIDHLMTFLTTTLKIRPPLLPAPTMAFDPTVPTPVSLASLSTGPVFSSTTLKAVSTTTPRDPKARKQERMVHVKAKRAQRRDARAQARERLKREGVMINGRVRGGTEAVQRARLAEKEAKTEKNRKRQAKMKRSRDEQSGEQVLLPV